MIKVEITDSISFVFPTTQGKEAYGYVEEIIETEEARSGAFAYTYFFDLGVCLPVELNRAIKVEYDR